MKRSATALSLAINRDYACMHAGTRTRTMHVQHAQLQRFHVIHSNLSFGDKNTNDFDKDNTQNLMNDD